MDGGGRGSCSFSQPQSHFCILRSWLTRARWQVSILHFVPLTKESRFLVWAFSVLIGLNSCGCIVWWCFNLKCTFMNTWWRCLSYLVCGKFPFFLAGKHCTRWLQTVQNLSHQRCCQGDYWDLQTKTFSSDIETQTARNGVNEPRLSLSASVEWKMTAIILLWLELP